MAAWKPEVRFRESAKIKVVSFTDEKQGDTISYRIL